jgi:hypothetical protein
VPDASSITVVVYGRVHRAAIIPEPDITLGPVPPQDEFRLLHVGVEEVQKVRAFIRRQSDDVGSEERTDEQAFASGFRVHTDHGMLGTRNAGKIDVVAALGDESSGSGSSFI